MNKFSKSSKGGRPESRPRFGAAARPRFGSSSVRSSVRPGGSYKKDDAVKLYDAVCSKCGKKCQVPFRPSNDRPVYCKDCFGAPQQSTTGAKTFTSATSEARPEGKTIADLTRQIAAMNTKIDTMLKILEEGSSTE
jgi:CxxC-x17-CxxC domain-containing protein